MVSEYERDVTHVIATVNEKGMGTKRTLKLMQGIADGKWIVGTTWAEACVRAGKRVSEAPYELKG
jgi:hypothetical protein